MKLHLKIHLGQATKQNKKTKQNKPSNTSRGQAGHANGWRRLETAANLSAPIAPKRDSVCSDPTNTCCVGMSTVV